MESLIRGNLIQRKAISCIKFLGCCIFLSCSKSEVKPVTTFNFPSPIIGKTYTADEIIAFKQLSINSATNYKIVKLPPNVSFYLKDTAYAYLTLELDLIIRKLNMLDSNLTFSRTTDSLASTIKVYFRDRESYIRQEPATAPTLQNSNYTGYGYINWNSNGQIYHGSAFVDMVRTMGDTLFQRHVIHHEIMHTLGFLGHTSLPQFHTIIFKYTLTPLILDYTSFDKRMIQLLYNPAIKANMDEAKFNEAVKNL